MNESTARNIRVQDRYDELMRIGRHGHYETMFQVVREEIESLRQQLASCDAEIERLKTVPMRYRRMAFNAQLQDENAQLSQQLADSQKQVTLLREKFQELADNFVWNGDDHSYQHWVIEVSQAALTTTEPKQ